VAVVLEVTVVDDRDWVDDLVEVDWVDDSVEVDAVDDELSEVVLFDQVEDSVVVLFSAQMPHVKSH
jgi:hypothetical protein